MVVRSPPAEVGRGEKTEETTTAAFDQRRASPVPGTYPSAVYLRRARHTVLIARLPSGGVFATKRAVPPNQTNPNHERAWRNEKDSARSGARRSRHLVARLDAPSTTREQERRHGATAAAALLREQVVLPGRRRLLLVRVLRRPGRCRLGEERRALRRRLVRRREGVLRRRQDTLLHRLPTERSWYHPLDRRGKNSSRPTCGGGCCICCCICCCCICIATG